MVDNKDTQDETAGREDHVEQFAEFVLDQTMDRIKRQTLLSQKSEELDAALVESDEIPAARPSEFRAPAALEDE